MFYCGAKLRKKKAKCKIKVKKKRERCRLHGAKKLLTTGIEIKGTPYSKGNRLSTFYTTRLKSKTSVYKAHLKSLDELCEIDKKFLSTLEPEVKLLRMIIADNVNELDHIDSLGKGKRLSRDEKLKTIWRKQGIKNDITNTIATLSHVLDRYHKIKRGPTQSFPIEKVNQIFVVFNEILIRNIPDAEILKKIIGDIRKTIILEEREQK